MVGGTRGTGARLAVRLASAGVPVEVLGRSRVDLGPGVDVLRGDVTRPETLDGAVAGARAIVYTAGTRRFLGAGEHRAVGYDGVRAVLDAAADAGFDGRFVLMSSIGVERASFFGVALNVAKGGALVHKRAAEAAVRESGLDYAIVRAGMLVEDDGGAPVRLRQDDLELSLRWRIGRDEAAHVLAATLGARAPGRVTFDAVRDERGDDEPIEAQLAALVADDRRPAAA